MVDIERHMGLVRYIAGRYDADGMENDDLVQEGVVGLMEAAERFDPNRGCRFSTYAAWYIKRAIVTAIRARNNVIRTPRRRPPLRTVGVNCALKVLDDAKPVDEAMIDEEERDEVRDCVSRLPYREGIVIRLRYGIDTDRRTLREVGNILGVSRERARQIQVRAEDRIRTMMQVP